MIFEKDKLIYIKIPKTGSTSVAKNLLGHYGLDIDSKSVDPDYVVNINTIIRPNFGWYGWHAAYAEIANHVNDISEYRIFTIIREPTERLISVYKWQKMKHPKNKCLASFDRYISSFREGSHDLSRQAYIHMLPQTYWLEGASNNTTIRLFRTDKMDSKKAELEEFTGIAFADLHVNRSETKGDISVGEESRRFIEEYYAKDYVLFDACPS